MFHINDLDAMDEAQIKETAEAMGIKKGGIRISRRNYRSDS